MPNGWDAFQISFRRARSAPACSQRTNPYFLSKAIAMPLSKLKRVAAQLADVKDVYGNGLEFGLGCPFRWEGPAAAKLTGLEKMRWEHRPNWQPRTRGTWLTVWSLQAGPFVVWYWRAIGF
jgi:hypothetical protein